MSRVTAFFVLTMGLGSLAGLAPVSFAADPPKEADANSSKFVKAADVSGQIAKADSNGLTLRVPSNAPINKGQMGKGRMGRPNPLQQPQYQEYDLTFAEGALIRYATLPPKLDEDGKKVAYTAKEMEALRKPAGAKGYAADKDALHVGTYVEVILIRPRDIPAAKVQISDMFVKTVIIQKEGNLTSPAGRPGPKKNN